MVPLISCLGCQDVHRIGGIPAVMKYLLKLGWLHGDCLTVGPLLREECRACLRGQGDLVSRLLVGIIGYLRGGIIRLIGL